MFSAGHDFADMVGADLVPMRELLSTCTELMNTIQRLRQPVVARVHGLATAAGRQLVATADLAVAAEGAGFATPTGDTIDAATALQWGLVNRVVPADDLDAATRDLLERATRGSAMSRAIGKQVLYQQLGMDQDNAYAYAVEVMAATSQTADAQEGMASFLEKRPGKWVDR